MNPFDSEIFFSLMAPLSAAWGRGWGGGGGGEKVEGGDGRRGREEREEGGVRGWEKGEGGESGGGACNNPDITDTYIGHCLASLMQMFGRTLSSPGHPWSGSSTVTTASTHLCLWSDDLASFPGSPCVRGEENFIGVRRGRSLGMRLVVTLVHY